jgi:hypothetical protein
MDQDAMRRHYEQWCHDNRHRKTDASWELWREAYEAGRRSAWLQPLSDKEREQWPAWRRKGE